MLKFKKVTLLTTCVIILNLIFSLFLVNEERSFSSMYVHILNDYTYAFFFSMLLFINLYESMDHKLMVAKFKNIIDYILYKIKEKAISYAIMFIVFSFFQVLFFSILDPQFNLITLLYRNLIFYLFINIVYLLVIIGKSSRVIVRIISIYLFWNLMYFIAIILPDSIINRVNIFTLLQRIDLSEIFRYAILLLIMVVFCIRKISNKRRYISKWLD